MLQRTNRDFVFNPTFSSTNTKSLHIMSIEGITGLSDIESAFENRINETDVELLMFHLNKKYDLSSGDNNVYDFIVNAIGFSRRALVNINADYEEFYDNLTTAEACNIILIKMIDRANDIPAIGGFPSDFNFRSSQANSVQTTEEGSKWYPYVKGRYTPSYDQLLLQVMRTIQTDGHRLYFHGCSWESAISIQDEVQIIPRENATDSFVQSFPTSVATEVGNGMRNFYLTDTFNTAYIWSQRNNQAAIVIFAIPDETIDNQENKLEFTMDNINEWKQTVFTCRNKPRYGQNLRQRKLQYNQFLNGLDSNDVVIGPICANPGAREVVDINYVYYNHNGNTTIPLQYSFKDSLISQLNQFLMVTLFIQQV